MLENNIVIMIQKLWITNFIIWHQYLNITYGSYKATPLAELRITGDRACNLSIVMPTLYRLFYLNMWIIIPSAANKVFQTCVSLTNC